VEDFANALRENSLAIIEQEVAKLGLADSHGAGEHGLEHRLQIAWRRADDTQHLRGRGLLLKRFGKFARALLFGLIAAVPPRSVMNSRRLMGVALGPRTTIYHIIEAGSGGPCAGQQNWVLDFRNGSFATEPFRASAEQCPLCLR
jgi:hypothetical protein